MQRWGVLRLLTDGGFKEAAKNCVRSVVANIDIDMALARQAIRLRAEYGFRVPDALQLGAAIEHGATLFITNDRHLKRATELPVLILDDYVA